MKINQLTEMPCTILILVPFSLPLPR